MRNSPKRDLLHADLTESVIGAFYHVYNRLDYVEREVPVVIYFEGHAVGRQRVDMIMDGMEMQGGLLLHFGSGQTSPRRQHAQSAQRTDRSVMIR